MQALKSPDVRVLKPTRGWRQNKVPPKPERLSVIGWDASNHTPNCIDSAYRPKNGFPFPPEVILGGFLLTCMPGGFFGLSRRLHAHPAAPCSIYRERHCEVCCDRTGAFLGV